VGELVGERASELLIGRVHELGGWGVIGWEVAGGHMESAWWLQEVLAHSCVSQ
jgi:hypothetical protein